ncbi:MAG: 50S ribosomal protein L25 [Treponema sp.]|nr:50S ribosomal protein L25 [Treponema sp.]
MDQAIINAKTRTTTGKTAAKRLRAAGRLPAVMYDAKGVATMLEIDENEFNKVWRAITPTTLVSLKIDGSEAHDAFIKDTEYSILNDRVLHADFFEPSAEQLLTAKFKVSYTGTSSGVLKGGFMLKHLPEIQVKAVAKKMPHAVVADISALEIGDVLRVKDLKLGEGVAVLTDGDSPLVSIKPAR